MAEERSTDDSQAYGSATAYPSGISYSKRSAEKLAPRGESGSAPSRSALRASLTFSRASARVTRLTGPSPM